MQEYSNNVADKFGNALAGVQVLVTKNGVNATLFAGNGVTPIANPTTTNDLGIFKFFAANGTYVITLSSSQLAAPIVYSGVILYDPVDTGAETALRTDLAASGGSALVGSGAVSVASIADLQTASQNATQLLHVASFYPAVFALAAPVARGGGLFKWATNVPRSQHNGGSIISPTVPWNGTQPTLAAFLAKTGEIAPAANGCWVRIAQTLDIDDFGAVGESAPGSATMNDVAIRAAIAATPVGGTLTIDNADKIYMVDIPAGAAKFVVGFAVNKAITIQGNRRALLQVKPFCTGWAAWAGLNATITLFRTTSSGAQIHDLNIDCDADHHYELDGGGFKWWQTGPTATRGPVDGIDIGCDVGQNNVTGNRVEGCTVTRALQGIAARGGYAADVGNAAVLAKTALTGVVVAPVIRNNTISWGRGNGVLLASGVWSCQPSNNRFQNMLYHTLRMYNTTVDCHFHDNAVITNLTEIAARYNETDLGYFRTNKTADPGYNDLRMGILIGSVVSDIGAGNTGNIHNCSAFDNTVTTIGTAATAATIAVVDDASFSPLSINRCWRNVVMHDNIVNGSPGYGCTLYTPTITEAVNGTINVGFRDNEFNDTYGIPAFIQAPLGFALRNTFKQCVQSSLQGAALPTTHFRLVGDGIKVLDNKIIAGPLSAVAQPRYHISTASANVWVDGNQAFGPFTGNDFLIVGTPVVYGNNAPVTLITPINGWVNYSAISGFVRQLGFTISAAGEVEVQCILDSALSTAIIFGVIPLLSARPKTTAFAVALIPRDNGAFVAGKVYAARLDANGEISVALGTDKPTALTVIFRYRTDKPLSI